MPKSTSILLLSSVLVFMLAAAGTALLLLYSPLQPVPAVRACTKEAKLCPDGKTYVGRTGPQCEFVACPFVNPLVSPSTSASLSVDTTGWKIYRNEKYGFEVTYPVDWKIVTVAGGIALSEKSIASARTSIIAFTSDFGQNEAPHHYQEIDEVATEINNSEEWKKSGFECKFSGFLGQRSFDCVSMSSFAGDQWIYILNNNGYLFSIHDMMMNAASNKILSTFKFIK